MGIGPGYKHKYNESKYPDISQLPNPDPGNFKIVAHEQVGNFLVIDIIYPDCINFEGKKILLYENVNITDLRKLKLIDPHFSQNSLSPIARFAPTVKGKRLAIQLAEILSNS